MKSTDLDSQNLTYTPSDKDNWSLDQVVSGFSKMTKEEKISWLEEGLNGKSLTELFKSFWHEDKQTQKIFDDFSENTLTNYYLPFGIAPNFLINNKLLNIPMVIEESSVVAAASKSAKFWLKKGGFKAKVLSTKKIGHVHFFWQGDALKLEKFFQENKSQLIAKTKELTKNMEQRGGGLVDIKLVNKTHELADFFQVEAKFETCDAMGANFINSVLENIGRNLKLFIEADDNFSGAERSVEINMCILSNYTPECIVKAWVECPFEMLDNIDPDLSGAEFAKKFKRAIEITKVDPYRATTHNKGIFNGIDAVVLATGNDFRAVEACGHTHAAKDGQYRGLSDVSIENETFNFSLEIPLSLGTVGGLTKLHPLAKKGLEILEHPNAKELMMITAVVGLAQNFGAVRSLVTTGIQKGHMKMHLLNILNYLGASDVEIEKVKDHLKNSVISYVAVKDCLETLRQIH